MNLKGRSNIPKNIFFHLPACAALFIAISKPTNPTMAGNHVKLIDVSPQNSHGCTWLSPGHSIVSTLKLSFPVLSLKIVSFVQRVKLLGTSMMKDVIFEGALSQLVSIQPVTGNVKVIKKHFSPKSGLFHVHLTFPFSGLL